MSTPINPGARPTPQSDETAAAAQVQTIFNSIAPTYDRLNHLLSFGLDRRWWRSTARAFRPILARPESRVLDICCGTGDLTAALLAERPTASAGQIEPIIGLDFSAKMLSRAHTKYASASVIWVEGDAMHLPYPDNTFDLVTAAFGFRNLTNYAAALAELHRVLRPGGQLGILECNHPSGLSGLLYTLYADRILPIVGGLISGQRAAYDYLPASIARFPRPPAMKTLLRTAGFADPTWRGYFLHVAGLYKATKI